MKFENFKTGKPVAAEVYRWESSATMAKQLVDKFNAGKLKNELFFTDDIKTWEVNSPYVTVMKIKLGNPLVMKEKEGSKNALEDYMSSYKEKFDRFVKDGGYDSVIHVPAHDYHARQAMMLNPNEQVLSMKTFSRKQIGMENKTMKLNKAQLEEAVREACSKHKLKQEHRTQLEELLKEKISVVFEKRGSDEWTDEEDEDDEWPERRKGGQNQPAVGQHRVSDYDPFEDEEDLDESSQSGGTRGSGAEGQKDPEYRLDKWDRSSTPGVNKKTKRMYNKKNRQAAKKDLDESAGADGLAQLLGLYKDMMGEIKTSYHDVAKSDAERWSKTLAIAINDLRKEKKGLNEESDNPWPASWSVKKEEK